MLRTFVDNTEKPQCYQRGDSVVIFQYYQQLLLLEKHTRKSGTQLDTETQSETFWSVLHMSGIADSYWQGTHLDCRLWCL